MVTVTASPAATGTAAVIEPVKMMLPAASCSPRPVSVFASHAAACHGDPSTAAPAPVPAIRPLRRNTHPASARSRPVTGTGLWYKSGRPLVELRWVFVHDKSGTHRDSYFFTTDPAMSVGSLIETYTGRWNIETDQADSTSSDRWCEATGAGYH